MYTNSIHIKTDFCAEFLSLWSKINIYIVFLYNVVLECICCVQNKFPPQHFIAQKCFAYMGVIMSRGCYFTVNLL